MDKQTQQYISSTKAWIKTQQLSIDSCDMAIRHHLESIALLEKMIRGEQHERVLKANQLRQVEKGLKKYTTQK